MPSLPTDVLGTKFPRPAWSKHAEAGWYARRECRHLISRPSSAPLSTLGRPSSSPRDGGGNRCSSCPAPSGERTAKGHRRRRGCHGDGAAPGSYLVDPSDGKPVSSEPSRRGSEAPEQQAAPFPQGRPYPNE